MVSEEEMCSVKLLFALIPMQTVFFPDSVKNWNRIGFEVREISSLNAFKKKIFGFIRPQKKSIFGIHNPTGIKRLFQLRLGLSPLRKHKKDHNFADTHSSTCLCGTEDEDSVHFLFKCQLFSSQRTLFVDTVSNILTRNGIGDQSSDDLLKICLYGHPDLSGILNNTILQATISYILSSNRFSRTN